MKKYIAELIGTYALVLFGTGAVVVNELTKGDVTHLGICITFGLIVTIMIYTFGSISGTHINPAVTVGFQLAGCFGIKDVLPYIIAQVVGACMASATLVLLFSDYQGTLGATLPAGSEMQSFILEIILTYFLMIVILFVSQNKDTVQYTAVAVGAIVAVEALFGGPISGASMNPARSIGPALLSGNLQHLWIYIVAPLIGAALAAFSWKILK
jgi:aquaporin NIP